jgi:hypothetical protein
MRRMSDFLWCVVFAFVAVVTTIKLSGPQTVEASEVPLPLPELTMPKFVNPAGRIDLQIDLEKGTARIESNADVATVNTVVNHPASSVKPKTKVIVKKEIVTEYLDKVVMFPLPKDYIKVPDIKLPNRVVR